MNKKTDTTIKPIVRQANVDDFEKVYPLLRKINSTRLNRDDWFRLFENHWSIEEFSPGIVLECADDIVGFIGTIYSKQIVAGQTQLFCNLSSWIVLDEYRSHSVMMVLSLLRKKKIILTSFSSNDVTYELYKKLGFKDGNHGRRIVYPFFSVKSGDYQLINDVKMIQEMLQYDKSTFQDHCHLGNNYILVKHKDEQCLLMGVTRKKRFKLYYASNPSFLQQHLKHVRNKLMSLLAVNSMQIDEQLLNGVSLLFSRKVIKGNPYQYKTANEVFSFATPIYSEVFLLNM